MTKILLKKSSALDDKGTGPKLPTSDQLVNGEIAINFLSGHETISLKNSDNKIVPIKINGDGKILTETDIVDIEPDTVTDDYKVKPISAYRAFTGLNVLATRIYGANGLYSRVHANSNDIATNKTKIESVSEDMKTTINRLDALETQLKGVETQTTSIISQEDDIITKAR